MLSVTLTLGMLLASSGVAVQEGGAAEKQFQKFEKAFEAEQAAFQEAFTALQASDEWKKAQEARDNAALQGMYESIPQPDAAAFADKAMAAAEVGDETRSEPLSDAAPDAVTSMVFREGQAIIASRRPTGEERAAGESGDSFLSVPIRYTPASDESRTVGVVNLIGRQDGGRFSAANQKLLAAIAISPAKFSQVANGRSSAGETLETLCARFPFTSRLRRRRPYLVRY